MYDLTSSTGSGAGNPLLVSYTFIVGKQDERAYERLPFS